MKLLSQSSCLPGEKAIVAARVEPIKSDLIVAPKLKANLIALSAAASSQESLIVPINNKGEFVILLIPGSLFKSAFLLAVHFSFLSFSSIIMAEPGWMDCNHQHLRQAIHGAS